MGKVLPYLYSYLRFPSRAPHLPAHPIQGLLPRVKTVLLALLDVTSGSIIMPQYILRMLLWLGLGVVLLWAFLSGTPASGPILFPPFFVQFSEQLKPPSLSVKTLQVRSTSDSSALYNYSMI